MLTRTYGYICMPTPLRTWIWPSTYTISSLDWKPYFSFWYNSCIYILKSSAMHIYNKFLLLIKSESNSTWCVVSASLAKCSINIKTVRLHMDRQHDEHYLVGNVLSIFCPYSVVSCKLCTFIYIIYSSTPTTGRISMKNHWSLFGYTHENIGHLSMITGLHDKNHIITSWVPSKKWKGRKK